jgi:predicted regulator of Ras-like GTPase activity (Roadblock/LC7/MglB family)
MDPQEALADLKQISVQVSHALIGGHDGTPIASTLSDAAAAERLARTAVDLWEQADRTRRDLGRDELAQLEVATPDGSVFVVRDATRMIVATTSSDPTVGLVFYDLKASLRAVAEGDRTSEDGPEASFRAAGVDAEGADGSDGERGVEAAPEAAAEEVAEQAAPKRGRRTKKDAAAEAEEEHEGDGSA